MMKQPLNRLLNRKLMYILWGMQKLLAGRCTLSISPHPTSVATLTILSILSFQHSAAPLPQVSSVTVKTRAPQNELMTVWYRISKNYHPRRDQMLRVQVSFGKSNRDGVKMSFTCDKLNQHVSNLDSWENSKNTPAMPSDGL